MNGKNIGILLIEDNEIDVMAVQRAFKKANLDINIVVAADGREGLEKLRDGKSVESPYVVLLDLNMPRMNGIEFLEEVRSDPHLKSTVVFVLTTSSASEDMKKAYEHNVAGYIVKGKTERSFSNTADLCEHYARIVELP